MSERHIHLCSCCMSKACGITRRDFMTDIGIAAGGLALASLGSLSSVSAASTEYKPVPTIPLKVQPVLACTLFQRKEQTSWRPWGGLHTQENIQAEQQRINQEMDTLRGNAEFPMEILPLVTINDVNQAGQIAKGGHDVLLLYAANTGLDILETLTNPDKWTILFVRHKSGPVSLWYEIVHVIYLRKHVDAYGQAGMTPQDVVVDKMEDVLWRLRALYGLRNTIGKKIVAVGGPSGWGPMGHKGPEVSGNLWKMAMETVDYPSLRELIQKARANDELVKRCRQDAKNYLKQNGITLETREEFISNAFVLNEVFKQLLDQAGTDAFTINECMSTIMPASETTACLPLTLLNDSGYNAYCESDFVVIPSGILLHYISGRPVFLNDPTYPHDNIVTLAHCTAPRKMNGKEYEPARILTHFESDYGAAPKVEMKKGQTITVLDPDFACQRWLGFEGEIVDNPFLDICRSQIDVQIHGDCDTLVEQSRGFHWMACYGNYLKEVGYALKKMGVDWMNLTVSKPA